jgi:hypothetical protein
MPAAGFAGIKNGNLMILFNAVEFDLYPLESCFSHCPSPFVGVI